MVSGGAEQLEETVLEGSEVGLEGRVELEGSEVEEDLRQQTAAGRTVAQLQREMGRVRVV